MDSSSYYNTWTRHRSQMLKVTPIPLQAITLLINLCNSDAMHVHYEFKITLMRRDQLVRGIWKLAKEM